MIKCLTSLINAKVSWVYQRRTEWLLITLVFSAACSFVWVNIHTGTEIVHDPSHITVSPRQPSHVTWVGSSHAHYPSSPLGRCQLPQAQTQRKTHKLEKLVILQHSSISELTKARERLKSVNECQVIVQSSSTEGQ